MGEDAGEPLTLDTIFGAGTAEATKALKAYLAEGPEDAEEDATVTYLGKPDAKTKIKATIVISEEVENPPIEAEAEVTVTAYDEEAKANAIINAVRTLIKKRGEPDRGTISIKGNVVTASGDIYYAGALKDGESEETEGIDKIVMDRSVLRDLSIFLQELHTFDPEGVTQLAYGEGEYSWTTGGEEQKNPWQSEGTTIIAAIATAAEEANLATEGGTFEVELTATIDGAEVTIVFKTVIEAPAEEG